MPQRGDLEPCGPKDAEGQVRERIQTNGRCEAAIERGDTYGPVSYLAYVPAVAIFPWSGKWDSLPGRARDLDRVRPARGARARPRRAAVRRPSPRCAARLRVGCVPVHGLHAEREHERRDHAGVPPLRLLARHVGLGARRVGRARRLDEVRRAARRAAVGDVPGLRATARAPLRGRVRGRERCSPSRSCSSSRRCGTPFARSGSAPSASSPGATRRSRSGAGVSTTREGFPTSDSFSPWSSSSRSRSRRSWRSSRGARARSSWPRSRLPCSSPSSSR